MNSLDNASAIEPKKVTLPDCPTASSDAVHPLKLRLSSHALRKLSYASFLRLLREWSSVAFVLDKLPRRHFAQCSTPEETTQFLADVDGKLLHSAPIKVSRCTLDEKEEFNTFNHKSSSCASKAINVSAQGFVRSSLPSPPLPFLVGLKQRRLGRFDVFTLSQKVTPLAAYSYPSQLRMKEQFIKTCVRSLTRHVYEALVPRTPRTKRQRKNSEGLVAVPADETQEQQEPPSKSEPLLWCSPEASKRFFGCSVDQTIASPTILGYRNKCEFTIGHDSELGSRVQVGFVYNVVNHNPIVRSCSGVLSVPLCMQELCFCMRTLIETHPRYPVYCRRSDTGIWRLLMIRAASETQTLMVVVQIRTLDARDSDSPPGEMRAAIVKMLIDQLIYNNNCEKKRTYDGYTIASLFLQERTNSSDAFEPDGYELIYGSPTITHKLLGLCFNVGPASFFQTNTEACASLYKKTFELLDITRESLVLDICSGVGTITLCLHRNLRDRGQSGVRLIGVEMVQSAVEDARANAARNGVTCGDEVDFICARAEDAVPKLVTSLDPTMPVTAIVDPPRGGLHPLVLSSLAACANIRRLVYISCNPDSLVRDATKLCVPSLTAPSPFKPVKAVPVDMFPHTYHCEMIFVLERMLETYDT